MSNTKAQTSRTPLPLREIAFHEAGHVAVAHYFGLPIMTVTIVPDERAIGHVFAASPLMLNIPPGKRRQAARAMILSSFAGLHAQRLVAPNAEAQLAHGDCVIAFELSREYGVFPRWMSFVGDDAHFAFLRRLNREAGRLVRRLSGQIEDFAEALLQHRTLSGKDAARLLEGEAA